MYWREVAVESHQLTEVSTLALLHFYVEDRGNSWKYARKELRELQYLDLLIP